MSFGIPIRNGLSVSLASYIGLGTARLTDTPALSLDFVGSTTLDPRITFTRTTTGTFIGSNGLIQSAAIDAPRYDYDPTTLALRGLLIEGTRTNLFLASLLNGTVLLTQNVTVTAQAYTISFYGTGTITLSGTASATITGTGAYPARTTYTFTPTAGTLICTVSGTVQFANCEAGAFASSFIPTAATTVQRTIDTASMTGTNFTSWFNASAGTFVAVADTAQLTPAPIVLGYSSLNTSSFLYFTSASNASTWNNSTALSTTGGAITNNTPQKAAMAYTESTRAVCLNRGAIATDSAAIGSPTGLYLGKPGSTSAQALFGHLSSVTYYNTYVTNAQLRQLTT